MQERSKDVDFIFIGCDGVFECMNSAEIIKFFNSKLKKINKGQISSVVESLFAKNLPTDIHLSEGKGLDNMTGILVTIN